MSKKPDDDERSRLSKLQYSVTREAATEPAFSGEHVHYDGKGTFRCVCCGARLFRGHEKFDSGSGWPSFWAPAGDDSVTTHPDTSHGMRRTEVRCSGCAAHLGHLFDDGPQPSGQRFCINSAALDLDEGGDPPAE